jgi:hypothetical protein
MLLAMQQQRDLIMKPVEQADQRLAKKTKAKSKAKGKAKGQAQISVN